MNYFFDHHLSLGEKQRLSRLEPFDEFEEWQLKCSHYMILTAYKNIDSVIREKSMETHNKAMTTVYQSMEACNSSMETMKNKCMDQAAVDKCKSTKSITGSAAFASQLWPQSLCNHGIHKHKCRHGKHHSHCNNDKHEDDVGNMTDGKKRLSDDVPSDGQDVPSDGQDVPGDGQDVPSDGQDVPGDVQDVPGDGQDVPSDGHAVPSDGQDVPSDRHVVPSDGHDVPSDGQDVPSDGHDVPSDGQDVPSDGHVVPSDGQDVPSDHHVVPSDGHYVPSDGHVVPSDGQDVPSNGHDVPSDGHVALSDDGGEGLGLMVNSMMDLTTDECCSPALRLVEVQRTVDGAYANCKRFGHTCNLVKVYTSALSNDTIGQSPDDMVLSHDAMDQSHVEMVLPHDTIDQSLAAMGQSHDAMVPSHDSQSPGISEVCGNSQVTSHKATAGEYVLLVGGFGEEKSQHGRIKTLQASSVPGEPVSVACSGDACSYDRMYHSTTGLSDGRLVIFGGRYSPAKPCDTSTVCVISLSSCQHGAVTLSCHCQVITTGGVTPCPRWRHSATAIIYKGNLIFSTQHALGRGGGGSMFFLQIKK